MPVVFERENPLLAEVLAAGADRLEMTAPAPARDPGGAEAAPSGVFVARQPILTKGEKVFGYELLFRDGI
jgi:hypothetical protein